MTINGHADPVGELATARADKSLLVKKNGNYKKGIAICKEAGCTRIVEGHCYGWDDPLYMWKHYGECPHLSKEKGIIKEIEQKIAEYEQLYRR
jgi:hypothetical protein